jgi:hypothetical protein
MVGFKGDLFAVLYAFGGNVDTSPLSPLQPDVLVIIRKYLWLERGVQVRGGYRGGLKSTLCFSLPSAGSGQALYERRETGNKRLERWKTLGGAFKRGETPLFYLLLSFKESCIKSRHSRENGNPEKVWPGTISGFPLTWE